MEVVGLALLFTALNAVKPLHIDDTAYSYFSRQFAAHPLDPYGFRVFWYQNWQPAQQVLAPPVLPAWWAIGLHLFGERPLLWKLWLAPFCLLFVWALAWLFGMFTPGVARPLLWMTVLSPVCLPALNLMLDIPAMALALVSIVIFIRACQQSRILLGIAAGVVAGMAMQTKYTALVAPAVFGAYGLCMTCAPPALPNRRRWMYLALGVLSGAVALGIFAGWEAWLAWAHPADGSHFLYHLRDESSDPLGERFLNHLSALPALLGGMAAGVGLLACAAMSRRRMVFAIGALWISLTYLVIFVVGARFNAEAHLDLAPVDGSVSLDGGFPLEALLFGALGFAVAALVLWVCYRLVGTAGAWWASTIIARRPVECFLVGWLLIELGGYFAMSPFPATRRCIGLVIVATLLCGRLAFSLLQTIPMRRFIWATAILNIALGVLFYAVDLAVARAGQTAAEQAAAWIKDEHGGGTIWFTGHWGFQFYAEQAAMRPLDPGNTRLAAGDWLVVPDSGVIQQFFTTPPDCLEAVHVVPAFGFARFTTVARDWGGYYCTGTGAPLFHQDGPQVSVTIYRVRRACRPK